MEPLVRVENRAGLAGADFGPLSGILSNQHSIKRALDWGLAIDPPVVPTESIAQDEFSYDILFPYRNGLFLSYDTG